MIMLLGASGYVGQAFARELRRRERCFIPLTRKAIDYTQFGLLFDYIRKMKPEFVINAAGYVGRPNVDACEQARDETLRANAILPQTVSRACLMTNTPWANVSSGGIYSGAKVAGADGLRVENDLSQPALRSLFTEKPELFRGFTEWDEPNFSFRRPPCNFYSGTKALADEEVRSVGQVYLWRRAISFPSSSAAPRFTTQWTRSPTLMILCGPAWSFGTVARHSASTT
jgi:dTDP-4-dehydrorhamnose reductase